jgi:DNA polymerase-1
MTMLPVGVSFCDGERTAYIDLYKNAEIDEIMDFLGPVFERGLYIAHNAKFDIKCTRKFCNVESTNIFCTYIASFLLDENRLSHGLKVLAQEDLHIPAEDIKGWDKAKNYGYDSEQWYHYCFNDAEWAWRLYELYKPQLTEQGLDHVFYDIEMPFQFVLVDMEINGVKVDLENLNDLERRTSNKLIELEDRMFATIGERVTIQNRLFGEVAERILPFNLRSGVELKKCFAKKCGLGIVKDTRKQTIENLKGKHPFIDFLIDYKKLRKLYDAYIVSAFDLIGSDGRIHPSYGIVKTGRLNCRNPNLQQLPNVGKQFPDLNYRSIFVAEPNASLVGGDYSGQELRCLGEVSGDEKIIESFRNGFDLHLVTANFIFELGLLPCSLEEGTPEHKAASITYNTERYKAKNGVNFPIVYGTSEYGVAFRMGVSVETAKAWIAKFFELYPDVKVAMNETKIELEKNSEVSTMMGRKRRFPNYKDLPNWSKGKFPSKSRAVRQAFNFKIQGFSADQAKIAAIMARKSGLKIILMVHDEVLVECREKDIEQTKQTLKSCMENAVSLTVPFVVDCKICNRYSEFK